MNVGMLLAAGVGSRMKMSIPKQFLVIGGKPIYLYVLEKMEALPELDSFIVVTLPDWVEKVRDEVKRFGAKKVRDVIAGGSTSQESILNGLRALEKFVQDDDLVITVDGNRPLIPLEVLADSIAVCKRYGNAICSMPCIDAVFRSPDGDAATEYLARGDLYGVQKPETYSLAKLRWIHAEAAKRGIANAAATAPILHALGETVHLSKGSDLNFKITTQSDLALFAAWLKVEESNR